MRYQLFLTLFAFCVLVSFGCRSRHQVATTTEVQERVVGNSYWAGCDTCEKDGDTNTNCDDCDVCDSQQPAPVIEDAPVKRGRIWRWFSRFSRNEVVSDEVLVCQNCDSQQSVLVNGMCNDCLKGQVIQPNTVQNEIPRRLPLTVFEPSDTSRRLPNPDQVESSNIIPDVEKLPVPKKMESSQIENSVEIHVPLDAPSDNPTNQFQSVNSSDNTLEIPGTVEPNQNEPVNQLLNKWQNQFESSISDFLSEQKKAIQTVPETNSSTQSSELEAGVSNARETVEPSEPEANSPENTEPDVANTSTIPTGISGAASVQPDPKFETFSLKDLFTEEIVSNDERKKNRETKEEIEWGPPQNVSSAPKSNARDTLAPRRNFEELPDHRKPPSAVRPTRQKPVSERREVSYRSEEEVFRDLKNATISNRVVHDNTPTIIEEIKQPEPKEIVLRANPVEFYQEIQQLVREKARRERAADSFAKHSIRNGVPAMPAKTQIRSVDESDQLFEFNQLPNLSSDLAPSLSPGTASSIADDVFEPYEFPEMNNLVEPSATSMDDEIILRAEPQGTNPKVEQPNQSSSEDDERSIDSTLAINPISQMPEYRKHVSDPRFLDEIETAIFAPTPNWHNESLADVESAAISNETIETTVFPSFPTAESSRPAPINQDIMLRAVTDREQVVDQVNFNMSSQARFKFSKPSFQREIREK